MNNYVAIGDLVLDVYHDSENNILGYYSGGSIWNDLVNIKGFKKKANCYAIGTCGDDWAGDLVMTFLSQHGIELSNIYRVSKQTNRFNIIVQGENTKCQKSCPVCKQSSWYSGSKYPTVVPDIFKKIEPGIVIVDCLRQNVLGLAQEFKKNNWLVAADIGFTSHLRYLSIDSITSLLTGRFDLLQLNYRVYSFLLKKFSISTETELFDLVKCRCMSITNGSKGAKILIRDKSNKVISVFSAAKSSTVRDVTGAGDMFFSTILSYINEDGFFDEDIEKIMENASQNAADRIKVIGALGILKQIKIPNCGCHICGVEAKPEKSLRSKRQRIETNTNHLRDRIFRSLESEASTNLKQILKNTDGMIYMVGTGGSFVSACYAAEVVNSFHRKANAFSYHPRDVLINGLKKADLVILFSYSGKTKDILNIYDQCLTCNIPVYLITKMKKNDMPNMNTSSIISYSNSSSDAKERGFLSMAGTLIPMCIFGKVYYDESDSSFKEFLTNIFSRRCEEFSSKMIIENYISVGINIDVFYDSNSNCAALDMESKFIESGVGRITLHEKKDFSHGRFNILEKMPPSFIIYFENSPGHYSDKLKSYLKKRNIPMVILQTEYLGVWGQLDLMIAAQYFLKAISKYLNYDMSKPDYPQDAMSLYRYAGKDLL